MFPNDDICNVKAAKDAAKRIFNRYKEPTQVKSNSSSGLGEKQVSNLIKNAYQAINISFFLIKKGYDPSSNDVSSFMSVFGVGQDGKIKLDKIQELAVKYLCGQNELKNVSETKQQQRMQKKTQTKEPSEVIGLQKNINTSSYSKINQNVMPLTFKINGNKSPQLNNHSYLSPRATQTKYQFVLKENANFSPQEKYQQKADKSVYSQMMNKAHEIFHVNKDNNVEGITVNQAPKVLALTYQLIGKKNYLPTQDDVKVWMKLCDTKRLGIVDWTNYENFVRRLLERENIKNQL